MPTARLAATQALPATAGPTIPGATQRLRHDLNLLTTAAPIVAPAQRRIAVRRGSTSLRPPASRKRRGQRTRTAAAIRSHTISRTTAAIHNPIIAAIRRNLAAAVPIRVLRSTCASRSWDRAEAPVATAIARALTGAEDTVGVTAVTARRVATASRAARHQAPRVDHTALHADLIAHLGEAAEADRTEAAVVLTAAVAVTANRATQAAA
jgi:hypothetical protein